MTVRFARRRAPGAAAVGGRRPWQAELSWKLRAGQWRGPELVSAAVVDEILCSLGPHGPVDPPGLMSINTRWRVCFLGLNPDLLSQ